MMNSNEYLMDIIRNLSRYFLPIIICIGNLTSLLSLIIFAQKSMRKNSNGLYFLSFTLSNLIFLNISINTTFLYFGYNIDPTGGILLICQFEFYIGFVTSLLSSIFLVFASINRFLMTSSSYYFQRLNTRTLTIKLIILFIFLSCLIHIHVFFFIIPTEHSNNRFSCQLKTDEYILIIGWYIFLVLGILTPALMIFFGIRTIHNVHSVMINSSHRLHSIDRQMILIMLFQCLTHTIFRLPLPIYLFYEYLSKYLRENFQYSMNDIFFNYISLICFYIPFSMNFFINLISFSFRMELKRLIERLLKRQNQSIRRLYKHRRQLRIYPQNVIIPRTNRIEIGKQ